MDRIAWNRRALADVHGCSVKNLRCSSARQRLFAATAEEEVDRRQAESILPPRTSAVAAAGAARGLIRFTAAPPGLHEGSHSA